MLRTVVEALLAMPRGTRTRPPARQQVALATDSDPLAVGGREPCVRAMGGGGGAAGHARAAHGRPHQESARLPSARH